MTIENGIRNLLGSREVQGLFASFDVIDANCAVLEILMHVNAHSITLTIFWCRRVRISRLSLEGGVFSPEIRVVRFIGRSSLTVDGTGNSGVDLRSETRGRPILLHFSRFC